MSTDNAAKRITVNVPIVQKGKDDTYEVVVFIIPEGKSELDCLFCNPACSDDDYDSSISELITHGDGGNYQYDYICARKPIKRGSIELNYTMQAVNCKATDDGLGKISGVNVFSGTVNYDTGLVDIYFTKPPDKTVYSNVSEIRINYLDEEPDLPELVGQVGSGCIGKIRWGQDSISPINSNAILLDSLYMTVDIPQICGLRSMSINFEISGNYSARAWDGVGEIVSGSVKYLYDRIWKSSWLFGEAANFYPGELITAVATLRSEVQGKGSLVAGYSWFELPLLTSAIIRGCGLWDGEEITDGGADMAFKDSYRDETTVVWLVLYKGFEFWLKGTDYAEYEIGERVLIYKASSSGIAYTRDIAPITDNVTYDLNVNEATITPFEMI